MNIETENTAGEMTIGSRIRKLRIQKGMTQMQLADELHIANKARLSNYENGRREVPLEVVILMADYFQISTDYILQLPAGGCGNTGSDGSEKEKSGA